MKLYFSTIAGRVIALTALAVCVHGGEGWSAPARAESLAEDPELKAVNDGLLSARAQVRVRALRRVARRRMIEAREGVRRVLDKDRSTRVKLVAMDTLVALGDQASRELLVRWMRWGNKRVARGARTALRALDRVKGHPRFFVVLDPPTMAGNALPPVLQTDLVRRLQDHIRRSDVMVLSGGEEDLYSAHALQRHLRWRRLVGVSLLTHVSDLTAVPRGSDTDFRCKLNLTLTSLGQRQMSFSAWGEASSPMATRSLNDKLRLEITGDVLDGAVRSAVGELVEYLSTRGSRRARR